MNLNKIFDQFLVKVMKRGTYATKEEVEFVTHKMLDIIEKNSDKTPEELVEMIIKDNIKQLEEIRNKYPIPGYNVGINVWNINVKIFGGKLDYLEQDMRKDALFDIASMTKFYTEVIAYNLIKEKAMSFNDKIIDLDYRFTNVGSLTIGEVLSFSAEFKTDGRIAEKDNIEDAKECLYKMKVISTDNYNYNDMGMMLMKEVMEKVTNKTYQELVDYYIVDRLGLKDTHLVIPKQKIERFTGSANATIGAVNDPSALAVGGYSGHAGIITSNDDLIRLGQGVRDDIILTKEAKTNAYTKGFKFNRGKMGNTYIPHEKGIEMSYVDCLESKQSFNIQGSTRTNMNFSEVGSSTILLNPASMGLEHAKIEEEKINFQRALEGKNPISLVKHYVYNNNEVLSEYDLIDTRKMCPSVSTVEPITTMNAITSLRLEFLSEVIKEYDRNYNKEINVERKVK